MAPTVRTAIVLSAGLGVRLKTLTAQRPKPLLPVANRPLVTYAFDHLLEAGVERLIVNTHWRPEAFDRAFPEKCYRGAPVILRHEAPEVLESAGGIKNVQDLLEDAPFLVHNGDILSTLPLAPALAHHLDSGNEVTLILRSKGGPLQIGFDESSGRILDVAGRLHPAGEGLFLFTGIYVVSPEFLRRVPPARKLSVIPIFCDMIREDAKLGGIVIDEGAWWDLGTREQYLAVHRWLAETPLPSTGAAPWVHP
nr:nucleotidyltransferase family protein [Verrucomicrobiota bacterium]